MAAAAAAVPADLVAAAAAAELAAVVAAPAAFGGGGAFVQHPPTFTICMNFYVQKSGSAPSLPQGSNWTPGSRSGTDLLEPPRVVSSVGSGQLGSVQVSAGQCRSARVSDGQSG